VNKVDLTVAPGSIHGLIGPNGSGKTTLLNVVSGYYPVDAGTVVIGGTDVTRWSATRRSGYGIARTFQQPRLLEQESVLTNVMLGALRLTRATVPEWLCWVGRAGAEQRRHTEQARECLAFLKMEHLESVLSGQLAHGQRRLVEVARALLAEPRLLLLDEPAAGLPPNQVERLGEVITTVKGLGITVLLVEHNVELVSKVVDWLSVMDAGSILASGPPLQVIEQPEVLAAYVGAAPTATVR
jgi:ABC-type branched-subunit amino acid transport system ATPase component